MSEPEKNLPQNAESQMKTSSTDSNKKLAGAKEALKEKLMQAVLQQAIQEMGSPEAIADGLVKHAAQASVFEEATQFLVKKVIAEIESRSMQTLSDSSAATDQVFSSIKESAMIPDAVQNIRTRVIEDIQSRSVESISNQEAITDEVYASIDNDKVGTNEVVARLRSRLLDEIQSRAAESVADFDAVAREMSNKLRSETSIVDPILGQLRTLLLERIEDRAMVAMQDADAVASSIAGNVSDTDDVIVYAVEALRQKLISRVRDQGIDTIKNANQIAEEITSRFESEPREMQEAVTVLHDHLIEEIAQTGLQSIKPAEQAAKEAHGKVDQADSRIADAKASLHARLLEDLTQSAISELSNSVQEAGGINFGDIDVSDLDISMPESTLLEDATQESVDSFGNQEWNDEIPEVAAEPETEAVEFESDDVADLAANDFSDVGTGDVVENQNIVDDFSSDSEQTGAGDDEVATGLDYELKDVEQPFNQVLSNAPEAVEAESPVVEEPAHEGNDAFYVYGIVSESEVPADEDLPSSGIDPSRPVELVGFNGLRAVVSRVPMEDFSGDSFKARLQDKDWLKEKVRLHSGVLDAVNKGRTIIPMRFCTVYRSEEEVAQVLSVHHSHYSNVMDKIEGKKEWSLRIYRDEAKLAAKVEQSDRVVEDSLGSISKGVVTFVKEEMNRLNSIGGEQAIELMSQHCSSRSHAALLECASDGIMKPGVGDNGEQASDVVLNAAYLVAVSEHDKFRDEVDRLASEYSELGFRFEVHGPWPPYHFVGEPKSAERTVSA